LSVAHNLVENVLPPHRLVAALEVCIGKGVIVLFCLLAKFALGHHKWNLFGAIFLDDVVLRHCVVEGLLLVHLVADPLALRHILLHVDCFLTWGQRLVHCSTFLLPAHIWNCDIPHWDPARHLAANLLRRLRAALLAGTSGARLVLAIADRLGHLLAGGGGRTLALGAYCLRSGQLLGRRADRASVCAA